MGTCHHGELLKRCSANWNHWGDLISQKANCGKGKLGAVKVRCRGKQTMRHDVERNSCHLSVWAGDKEVATWSGDTETGSNGAISTWDKAFDGFLSGLSFWQGKTRLGTKIYIDFVVEVLVRSVRLACRQSAAWGCATARYYGLVGFADAGAAVCWWVRLSAQTAGALSGYVCYVFVRFFFALVASRLRSPP